jgi:DNA-binding MarR family transcriptional regulator
MQHLKERQLYDEAFRLLGRIITRSDPGRLETWAGLGLSLTQLRVLFILRENRGLTARGLAETLNVTPSTLTRIMDRLVRDLFVTREEDPGDRRLVRHCLTPAGLDMVGELERTGRERMDRILSRLSQEQLEQLITALTDLSAVSDAVEEEEEVSQGVGV